MRVLRRTALLGGALALGVGSSVAGAPVGANGAESVGAATIAVHGTLVVAESDRPGGGRTSYGVALADGDIVPVRGDFAPNARSGAVFDGRLALPATVTRALAARGLVADPRRAALRLVDRRSLTLSVVGTPSVLNAVAPAVTGTVHRQFVAAIDNKGTLGQTDAQLLTHVTNVGSYWQGQSNGAITGVAVQGSVKHFDTATGTTACGLGAGAADFFNLVDEAAALFPTIDLGQNSSDQLVLFVPPSCSAGGTVGRGTVGSSFASGGQLIAESSSSIEGVYAHEAGHNYGFQHANVRLDGVTQEYYGIYDVMGFALPAQYNMLTALSTPYRVYQGITDPGEIQDVPLGDQTAPVHLTATIQPRSSSAGLRSVTVVNPDTGERLYLDDRSGTGADAGSAYAARVSLGLPTTGSAGYGPGVVLTTARATGGVDDLALDAPPPSTTRPTSLGAGGTWTNASGDLSVHVTSADAGGAVVRVDFTPATQDFVAVGTPVIGGNVSVGGAVTLGLGSWDPAPTTTTIRWTADGAPVPNTNDKTSFVPSPSLVGKQLVAAVTGSRSGVRTTVAQSAPVTVSAGTIPLLAVPRVTGAAQVGFVLHGGAATWGTMLSTVSGTFQWRADGADIPAATALDYTVKAADVGKVITLVETLSAPAYQTVSTESLPTAAVPTPVISPAPTPTVTGAPRVGTALKATSGTWMTGVTLGFQWYVGGAPVPGATGTSYTPVAGDLGRTVQVSVTGSRAGYPAVTSTSADTAAVGLGLLTTAKPTVGGKALVGRALTARPGAWTPGTTFGYAWYADGVAIKHATARRIVLTRALRGARISVRVTGRHPGYTTASRRSARTPPVV